MDREDALSGRDAWLDESALAKSPNDGLELGTVQYTAFLYLEDFQYIDCVGLGDEEYTGWYSFNRQIGVNGKESSEPCRRGPHDKEVCQAIAEKQ